LAQKSLDAQAVREAVTRLNLGRHSVNRCEVQAQKFAGAGPFRRAGLKMVT